MARWLGLALDPTTGGSTLDTLATPGPVTIPDPTIWIPGDTAQTDDGFTNTDSNNAVFGVRGAAAPVPFRAKPTLTFTVDLWSKAAKLLIPAALGNIGTPVGATPAAVMTPVDPAPAGGVLPTFFAWLVREGQTDRLSGVVVEQIQLTVETAVPKLEVTCRALYLERVVTPGTLPTVSYADYDPNQKYSGVMFKALTGPSGTEVPIQCVANYTMTFNNNLIDDDDVVYCRGENVLTKTISTRYSRRQWPGRHVLGEQTTSGNISFGTTRQDMEDLKLLASSQRLVAQLVENPLATTPPVDRMLRFVHPAWMVTGGDGADDLTRTDPIKSAYDWTAYIDPATAKEITAEFVDTAAITIAA